MTVNFDTALFITAIIIAILTLILCLIAGKNIWKGLLSPLLALIIIMGVVSSLAITHEVQAESATITKETTTLINEAEFEIDKIYLDRLEYEDKTLDISEIKEFKENVGVHYNTIDVKIYDKEKYITKYGITFILKEHNITEYTVYTARDIINKINNRDNALLYSNRK